MKKDDEREKEWEKDGRMRGKSKKEGGKKALGRGIDRKNVALSGGYSQ